jgi:hypothetical protein
VFASIDTEHALSAPTYEYYNLLWTFSKSECQDPRDKVYALQGILGQEERIAIDYAKSVNEVFRDAAVDIIIKASIASRSRHQSNLNGLDYRKPSDNIFADALENTSERSQTDYATSPSGDTRELGRGNGIEHV